MQTLRTVVNERRASPEEHNSRTDFLQYFMKAKPEEDPKVVATIMLAALWAGHPNTVRFISGCWHILKCKAERISGPNWFRKFVCLGAAQTLKTRP
jgi:cytochrome P450